MTTYISFRSHNFGPRLTRPSFWTGNGEAPRLALTPMDTAAVAQLAGGRHLLFAVHGFNVGYKDGARQLAMLERQLALGPGTRFFGVLWPGDYWLPFVNYPFEAEDAVQCGRGLAALCNGRFAGAASLSFVSHSLGGRLVLEAVSRLEGGRKARTVCLAAAAVDRNVLSSQYKAAVANAEHLFVLSSKADLVLRLAYPPGDFLSDIFGDKDSPFKGALGYAGPPSNLSLPSVTHSPIAKEVGCGHGGYLPEGRFWTQVAGYVRSSMDRQPPIWPV